MGQGVEADAAPLTPHAALSVLAIERQMQEEGRHL